MRLDRLEINGFKSFSDRSELAFDKGVTAIVGPNGCGKSNVADAITWVMGEQSAKSLRGERMEDVIFNGSDARKPTAAAEVRLRFTGVLKTVTGPAFPADLGDRRDPGNNVDRTGHGNGNGNGHGHGDLDVTELIQSIARDVEVTRRLFRSGESEYLIDGQTCRLRDVHDLLMDTGLGAKAYAIIEQGKIGLILSSRPTDRRQLIEEAAGVTKYKARRRAAELKLEAARQNLLRVDDIVFEVEKQRGTLKRQAGKARRYQKLRDELRRWEKVLFARKYRQLAETIESARGRLTDARERDGVASARVAQVENDLGRLRIEMAEAETRAASAREAAHTRELAMNRQQQQIGFDREQVASLDERGAVMASELATIEARREPSRQALAGRSEAARDAEAARERVAIQLAAESDAYEAAHREIEGLEADVEVARSDVFSAINSATALRHALETADTARDRAAETLHRLGVEAADVRIHAGRAEAERTAAADGLRRAHDAIEATRIRRLARESELASARIEHEWRARSVRAAEQTLAGLEARLTSLVELEAARASYGDAPRAVLAQANGTVNQQGAIADYLEVEPGFERAAEAYLGDLLQHVVVEKPEHAAAGFDVIREAGAGRCGFLIASNPAEAGSHDGSSGSHEGSSGSHEGSSGSHEGSTGSAWRSHEGPADAQTIVGSGFSRIALEGLISLSSMLRVSGPFAEPIRRAIGDAWIVDSYERAQEASRLTTVPVLTVDGVVFRGALLVSGGSRDDARGILQTKREIKELRERIRVERDALFKLNGETAALEGAIAAASHAIAALNAEHHKQEKAVVGLEAQLQYATDEVTRLAQKDEQLARERQQADQEREALDRRQEETRASIVRLQDEQQRAGERLTQAQRRLFEAREAAEGLSQRAAEARAAHAAMVERAAGLAAEVQRLEEAAADLDSRATSLASDLDSTRRRVAELRTAIVAGEAQLDADVNTLEALRIDVQHADEDVSALRIGTDEHEASLKVARSARESIRALVAELDVARATAESDLAHLATSCLDTVQATLDEVRVEVDELEQAGELTPDARVICAEEPEDADDGTAGLKTCATTDATTDTRVAGATPDTGVADATTETRVAQDFSPALEQAQQKALSAEEAITALRAKIDRLGPVNMMAIEQFDELETRHAFLTKERTDLVDSIAQTSEAITRIDETTRRRFSEAFAAINLNFQETFSTLFGGGRAGLTLLDETDPLESGIEIIAQPPGKRLQSVQLLSGGEKALTAIALMFGMFKYKPSPFCLLDEIDAPLDDANIGRFVEMLRGMQEHTQFIVITHNRKTMEIADRLYGVTMEEPGVSKLISVQLN